MTLLSELIEIPDQVLKGDFVINLAAAAGNAEVTLRDYVVTEQLADAYDNALGFVAAAVRENASKAAYLDGSFGSGKSHFMAVLHLLLQRNPQARSLPELAETIARHDRVLAGCSFDLVPVHMLTAETLEQRIFETYLEHLERTDPDAPPPALFIDEPIFHQTDQLRSDQGDEQFFATLNAGSEVEEGWGDLAAAWNPESYEAARSAPVGDAGRARLVSALIATHLPMFTEVVRGRATGWVDLDRGLAELTRHTRERGHDALVLFLDEVILWLGSRIGDPAFVAREGPKLVRLVEFSHTRQVPLISFLARQRDLRDFIGDEMPGAERLSFVDVLRYWSDRFHRIELTDRNLPRIAQRRLLKPVSPAAQAELDEAFGQLERSRPEVLQALLTEDADRETFRISYPFSPAFMKTLVAASSALQRERTALRVMLQLLVDHRAELELGDLVSVGELFDVLSSSDEPFSEDLRRQFNAAKKLYREMLRPLLLAEHQLEEAEIATLPRSDPFRGDDRLVGTLLLSALIPGAEPVRNLDIARLTALNHGSIATPIPGTERTIVLTKVRKLAAAGAPIRIGQDPQNPSVRLRLSGVDTELIVTKAEGVDNTGVRRQLVRRLLAEELGIDIAGSLLPEEHTVLWRGTWRAVDVVFGNVRDESVLPSDALRGAGERWKIVIDYPFDEALHSPADDLERLNRWRAENDSSRTVCWVPAFLSGELQRQLGRFVIIEHILEGERLAQFADHLPRQDQEVARVQLEEQSAVLRETLLAAIRQAYGVERATEQTIDESHPAELRLQSLQEGFQPQLPIGARLRDAFEGLVRSMLDSQYPDHPQFEEEVRRPDLRVVWEEVQRAVESGGRLDQVDSPRRRILRRIANPLELGIQHEQPFVLGETWKERLNQEIARARELGELEQLTVGDVRRLIDQPRPRGLTPDVSALVVLTYARQTGRTFRLLGGPAGEVGIERLSDELELVTAKLPGETNWEVAQDRAAALFGLPAINPARTSASVESFAAAVNTRTAALSAGAHALVPALEQRITQMKIDLTTSDRLRSARSAQAVVDACTTAIDPVDLVEQIAATPIPTTPQAVGASLSTAEEIRRLLTDARWQVIERLLATDGDGGDGGEDAALTSLRSALAHDEFSEPLAPAVEAAYEAGVRLITPPSPPPPGAPSPPPSPLAPPPLISHGHDHAARLTIAEAQAKLAELDEGDGTWLIDLTWTAADR
jgi:hypothetical protein